MADPKATVVVAYDVTEYDADGNAVQALHHRVEGSRFEFGRVVEELNHMLNGGELFPHRQPEPEGPVGAICAPCTCGHSFAGHDDRMGCDECHCTLYRPNAPTTTRPDPGIPEKKGTPPPAAPGRADPLLTSTDTTGRPPGGRA